jgi:hypothetical protein
MLNAAERFHNGLDFAEASMTHKELHDRNLKNIEIKMSTLDDNIKIDINEASWVFMVNLTIKLRKSGLL